jgi:uncharacterized repeat protein (TIGR01451 family)
MLPVPRSLFLLSFWASLLAVMSIQAAEFSPGNLVVYRVGTGTGSLVNLGNPVFLDEFTPAGTLVQSIALPTVVNGTQKRLVASGTAASEGQMTLSADGRYLLLPGYDATPPHSSSLTGTASSVVNRVIGRVDSAGAIDTSTALTDAFDANNFRGVTSDNGLRFWVAGNGNSTTGGVRFVQSLGATASTQLSTTNNNLRQPAIFGGQLYVSSGSGSTARLGTVGAGLPITASQTITTLPGYPVNLSPNAFVLLDLDVGVAGVDTLYIADDNTTSGGLLKYSFNGTTWTSRGSAGSAVDLYRGLTASKQGGDVILYAVRKGGGAAAGGGEVVTLTDSSGSTGTLTGTPTLLATAAANTAYRGIAFAPQKADLTTELIGPAGLLYTREPIDLQIKIRNGGGGTAYQVGGQFSLPSGLNYVSDTASGVGLQSSHSGGVLSFSGSTLAAQTEITLTVRVVTEATATYVLGAGAVVVDSLALVDESNEANNNSLAAADLVVNHAPDLKVSLSAPLAALTGSSGFEYTITAENEGLADASAVRVTLNLPVGLTFVSGAGSFFTTREAAGLVHLDGWLAANSSTTLTARVTAAADGTYTAPIGAAIIGPVPLTTLVESDVTNNSSTTAASTEVLTSDLTLSNVANGAFQAGDSASYTITISNVGTGSSQGGVAFSETLPAGLTATALTGTGWTIMDGSGETVSAVRSDALAAGQSYPPLTLQVAIATNAPTSVTSIANVAGGSDANDANNTASAATSILGAGPGIISLTSASFIVNEEDLALSFELARTSGRTGAVSVTVMTSNGTATAGADYTSVSTVIDFADNQNRRTVIVPLISDSLSEANETFTITLSSPTGGAALGTISSASVLILDPDTTAPKLTLTSPKAAQRLNEGAVTISGEVTDNKQVRRVQVKLNAGSYADASLTQASGKVLFSLPVNPVPGLNEVRVKATDFRGNESAEVIRSFTYVVKRPLTLVNGTGITLRPAEPLTALELTKSYTLTAKPAVGKVWNGWSSPQLTLTEAQRLSTTLNFTMVEGLSITANVVDDPFVPSVIGDFSGLLRADTGITPSHDNEGAIQVKVSPGGSFSGTLRIAGASLPFAGMLDTAGIARFGAALETSRLLSRSPVAGYVLAFSLDLSPTGTRKVTGSLRRQIRGGSEPLSVVEAHRHVGTATETFYTWAMPAQPQTNGLTPTQYPQGDAVGTLKLSKLGVANVAGVLADGTRFSSSMAANADMALPLFVSLEKGAGSLNGWMIVDHTRPDTDVSSTALHWFKPVAAGTQHYPFGWPEGLTLPLIGARFTVPVGESVLPDLSEVTGANALLNFTQGALTSGIQKELIVSPKNVVTKIPANDPSLSIQLTAARGQFGGTFQHSDGTSAAYTGVILQKGVNRRGFGHFITSQPKVISGSGQSGVVSLKTKFNPRLTLVISEFMANNETTIADEDGAFSDWIEIYNPGLDDVDLTDWCLTDNATTLAKWRFPAVTLGSRQFMLVWASSKNRRVPGQPLHTNFNLSAGGEYLALVRPDGVTVEHEFSPIYPAQANDESYGINFTGRALLAEGAAAKYRVPANDSLGTSWTAKDFADRAWTAGKTGLGFGVGVPGFTVRQVAAKPAFGGVNSIATCEALLALPKGHPNILSEATVIAPMINFLGDGSDGNYGDNAVLPNGTAEPYAFKATGIITLPTAGSYVFGLNSDDGGRIKIDGVAVMTDDSNHGPQDNLGAPVTLAAGTHTVEIIMWEAGGGDCVEFFAKAGTDTTWNADFKLVGSPDGLPVVTAPLTNTATASSVIGTNLRSAMVGKNASCYVRVPFTVTGISSLTGLTLQMRYNDGFVAYLNGTEVARRNAPATPTFNSIATGTRSAAETLTTEVIDLSAHIPLLVTGSNALAFHALNDAISDSSFLILPELSATAGLAGNAVFFRPADSVVTATPGTLNGVPAFAGSVAPLVFSQKHGFYQSPVTLAITTPTIGASIRYTLDGTTPTATHGTIYTRPLAISKTTIVRAIGYRSGFEPSPLLTQSYFFLNDVIRQSASGARPAVGWPAGTVNGQVADYGMDPAIVNNTNPEIGGVDKVKSALTSIPTISIVTDLPNLFDESSGIWVNPYGRGEAWERPASVEMIGDSGPGGGFEINCGLRLRGGFSRSGGNPKHALRLFFRSKYGASKLNYPLFGSEGTNSFDKIDFRTAQNYSWSFQGDGNNTFIREESTRELQGAMGQPYSRCRYYHLYLNGQYWGLYDTDERPEANFAESYIGGDADDYDTVKGEQDQGYITGVTDGNLDAWEALRMKARAHAASPTNANFFALSGKAADGVTPTTDPVLLEVDNLIDYMLLTFWTGNRDGATSDFLGDARANNWFAVRNRLGTFGGFRFLAHDFEHTFFNVDEDRTGPFPAGDPTLVETYNPMFIHHDLRPNAEYRMMWADRVQKHLFSQGALTPEQVQTRMRARKALLDKVIIAESARWGDAQRGTAAPFNRQDWLGAVDYVINNYVPERGSRVLAQLRADGLYPSFDAPILSQNGGPIASGAEVVINGQGGTIYYTLDGSDPRQIGGAVNLAAQTYTSSTETTTLVPLTQTWKYLADGSNQGTAWRAASFDDSAWSSGAAELGYGDGDEATTVPFVDVDPVAAGDQKNATTYFRTSFNVADITGITAAMLRVKYDDAVVLYLNGVEVAKSPNIASNPAHNQYASTSAPDEAAYFDFTLDPAALITGNNVLAAEIHQADSGSSDISFSASLSMTRTNTPTPLLLTGTGSRTLKVRAQNSGEWSALVEAWFDVRQASDMTVTLTPNGVFTAGSSASYTIIARNRGTAATAGRVTVTTTLPAGLTATSLTGSGWTISQGIATRNDSLAAGASYPPLTLTVGIATTAPALASVTTSVSGGGEITLSNDTDTDSTPIESTGTSQILFSAAAYEALEEGSNLSITLLRTGSRAGSASVRLRSSDGSAKATSDYSALNEVITFADGEGSRTIDIGLNNDGRTETHESFTLRLSEATGAVSLGLPNVATARILEADTKAPTVTLATPSAEARVVLPALTLTGSATDDKGLGKVQVALNAGSYVDAVTTLDSIGTSARWSLTVPAIAGANTVRVRAIDARGLVSNEVTRSFTFVPLRPLTLTVTPANAGTVSGNLPLLEVGKSYTLNAKPRAGFLFDRWTGPSINGEALTLTFTMSEGLAITANFAATPVSSANAGNYQGLVASAIGVTRREDNHGLISLTLTSAATFSGTLKLGESAHPFTGEVHPGGGARFGKERSASLILPKAGRASLALSIQFNLAQRTFMGHIGEQTRTSVAAMSAFGGGLRRAALPTNSPLLINRGMYKVKMTQVSPAAGTSGYPSVAEKLLTGTLARSGTFTLVGTLSDGTKVTASADLLESGRMALFDLLDAKTGSLATTLVWSETTPGFTSTGGLWFKPVTNQGSFPFGWPDGLIFSLEGEP